MLPTTFSRVLAILLIVGTFQVSVSHFIQFATFPIAHADGGGGGDGGGGSSSESSSEGVSEGTGSEASEGSGTDSEGAEGVAEGTGSETSEGSGGPESEGEGGTDAEGEGGEDSESAFSQAFHATQSFVSQAVSLGLQSLGVNSTIAEVVGTIASVALGLAVPAVGIANTALGIAVSQEVFGNPGAENPSSQPGTGDGEQSSESESSPQRYSGFDQAPSNRNASPSNSSVSIPSAQYVPPPAQHTCYSTPNSCGDQTIYLSDANGICGGATPPSDSTCTPPQITCTPSTCRKLVTKNDSCPIVWNVTNTQATRALRCTISGTGIISQSGMSARTTPITETRNYTINCKNGTVVESSVAFTCQMNPSFSNF